MALSIEASQIFPQSSRNVDASVIFRRIDLMHCGLSPERRLDAINEHLEQDPSRVQLAGLLAQTAAGSRLTWKACRLISGASRRL